jgi:predicted nucleic acid-binding protein
MKVLIDTNVILDVLMKREPHLEGSVVFLKLCGTQITGLVTTNQTTDIFYILKRGGLTSTDAKSLIRRLIENVKTVDVVSADVVPALDCEIDDYEDALISFTAKRQKANYIVTRNEIDFTNSPVPAISPDEFLNRFFC